MVHPPAMAETQIDVRYVAQLARINLSEDEISRFTTQLNHVMEHIQKLSEVDVDGIEPTAHPHAVSNQVRPDLPLPSLPPDGLLRNAPDQSNGQLRVPKVVDA